MEKVTCLPFPQLTLKGSYRQLDNGQLGSWGLFQ